MIASLVGVRGIGVGVSVGAGIIVAVGVKVGISVGVEVRVGFSVGVEKMIVSDLDKSTVGLDSEVIGCSFLEGFSGKALLQDARAMAKARRERTRRLSIGTVAL